MNELDDAPPDPAITPTLESTFAVDQLTGLAERLDRLSFVMIVKSGFGSSFPADVYVKLHEALREGSFAKPAHQVTEQNGVLVSYDNQTRSISVDRSTIEQALSQPEHTPPLLIAMLKAFAQHVDNVMRQDLAEKLADGTSTLPLDETREIGASYSAMISFFDTTLQRGSVFADYTSGGISGPLTLDLPDALPTDQSANVDETSEPLPVPEKFSAGKGKGTPGSFAHESIESALSNAGFSDKERRAIYFGNWLRDYSQLLDPKIVRAVDAPKDFPAKLSRAALTSIVDLLALREFHDLQDTEEGRRTYTVEPDMLGVYRPSEHIDNPTNLDDNPIDPRTIDPAFDPLVKPGDPRLEVDPERSMKKYFDSALKYMHDKLVEALVEGKTPAGMRSFGEALHVLEDFFAHSNFVELALRKRQHNEVLPWTAETQCTHRWPLVTGLFGPLDVIASIAEPIGDVLFASDGLAFKPTLPGDRSDTEKMLLILLNEDEDPRWLNLLNTYLETRDIVASNETYQWVKLVESTVSLPLKIVGDLCNEVFQKMLKGIGDAVDDLQTLTGDDPNEHAGTDATHSQLAKDHDTHPFHDLAAFLAIYAVEQVGRAMYEYWEGNKDRDPATLAKSFTLHPNDSDWQDDIVDAWAMQHKDKISTGSSAGDLLKRRKEYHEAAKERLQKLGVDDNYTPISTLENFNGVFSPF